MILLMQGDRTRGQEELPTDHEERLVLYYGVGESKVQGVNIVAIDCDAGISEVNQLNRIKLMLSVAKEKIAEQDHKAL